jgi:putative Mn2+ efflux pump MntP
MMYINPIGFTSALAAFLGIWLGHVSVRVIERNAKKLWPPIFIALVLGLALEAWSLLTDHWFLNAALGILGITLLWDSFEFVRQEKRVKKGHAPANPSNPRHARILADYPSATPLDLLKRDPLGRQVNPDEAVNLVTDH